MVDEVAVQPRADYLFGHFAGPYHRYNANGHLFDFKTRYIIYIIWNNGNTIQILCVYVIDGIF